jgi:SAM-dependent methyltransferase
MKYQDLVIKDGKFVGEFEKMYQEFSDPWNQSEEVHFSSLSRRSVCYFLEKFDINSIVEWGCGLGKTVNYIKENTGKDLDILGIDISKTAIDKAKNLYPKLDFKVDNILNISQYNNFDCMFFSEITWYLLEDKKMDKIFNIMSKNFKGKNKFFIHNLCFYKDGIQQYGKDYFTTLDEFIEFCPFELLEKVQVNLKDGIETSAIFKI